MKHVNEIESAMNCLTMIDLRRLAFDLAVRGNIAQLFTNGRSGLGEGIPRQAQHSPSGGPLRRAWLESADSTRLLWRSFSGTTTFYLRKV